MTTKQILTKAITKAIANGWEPGGHSKPSVDGTLMVNPRLYIYSHEFAQALWGGEQERFTHIFKRPEGGFHKRTLTRKRRGWKHHLKRMVVAKDPIKYLEKVL